MIIFSSTSHFTFIILISSFENFLKKNFKISSLNALVNIFDETLMNTITFLNKKVTKPQEI